MLYENLPWFIALWICVLVVRQLWHATHQPVPASVSSPKRKSPRPLKPRTPTIAPCAAARIPRPCGAMFASRMSARGANAKAPAARFAPGPSARPAMLAPTRTATITATPIPLSMPSSVTANAAPMASNGYAVKPATIAFPRRRKRGWPAQPPRKARRAIWA
jgi:hypothetical protein